MKKLRFLSLGLALLMGAAVSTSAQVYRQSSSAAASEDPLQTVHEVLDVAKSLEPGHNHGLLADGYTSAEKRAAEREAAARERAEAERIEALENPAIELYGEGSWTDWVNPFAGGKKADIPAEYEIDCSGFVQPLKGQMRITSKFGYRSRFRRNHYGVDLGLRTGDPVSACFDGKVRIRNYEARGYGHYVVIRHPNGLETVYGHMSKVLVKEGQIVKAGETIGLGGSTGRSTGPHLHLECRFMGIALDPATIIDFQHGQPQRDFYTFRHAGGSKHLAAKSASAKKDVRKSGYAAKQKAQNKTYTVRKGDSFARIAKRLGTTVSHLCTANRMSPKATIKPGQVLKY